MRRVIVGFGIVALALSACSKAPDGGDGGPNIGNGVAAAGLAFSYDYDLTLPARAIADLQEAHAAACEALGTGRCRITGLNYTVDHTGTVSANLAMRVAAPLARRFARQAVVTAEHAGATLTGARIGGDDVQPAATAAAQEANVTHAERARIDRELARSDLPAAERAELQSQRAAQIVTERGAVDTRRASEASLALAPIQFRYVTGHGAGFINQLREAGDTATASVAATITATLWLLAVFGPPLVGLVIVVLLWRRFGAPLWARLLLATRRRDHEPA